MSGAGANGPLVPGRLPEGWIETTLGDIAEHVLGKMLDKSKNRGELRPYLRNVNVQWGSFDLDDIKEMRIEDDERERYGLRSGDLVICEGGEPGRCAIWNKSDEIYFQKALHRVRPFRGVNVSYLARYLQYLAGTEKLQALFTGSTIKHLPGAKLRLIPVRLPPRAEQDRIVEAVESAMSAIEKGRHDLSAAQGLVAKLDDALKQRMLDEGEEKPLGELVERIEAGKSFRCEGRPAADGEWGIIKVSAMTWGEFRAEENKAVTDRSLVNPQWEIRPGDILVSRANTSEYVGASVQVEECPPRLLLSDKSLRLCPAHGTDPAWLQRAISTISARSQISALATGTKDSMRNISQSKLKAVKVRKPSLSRQRQLVEELGALERSTRELRSSVDAQMPRSEVLRSSILHRAFAGQLVPQDPNDEPASVLLERLKAEKAEQEAELKVQRNRARADGRGGKHRNSPKKASAST